MDQIKIGKFIAEERKAKKYTQRELADKLSISDKQSQNGKGVMVSQKYHCYFHFAMN